MTRASPSHTGRSHCQEARHEMESQTRQEISRKHVPGQPLRGEARQSSNQHTCPANHYVVRPGNHYKKEEDDEDQEEPLLVQSCTTSAQQFCFPTENTRGCAGILPVVEHTTTPGDHSDLSGGKGEHPTNSDTTHATMM